MRFIKGSDEAQRPGAGRVGRAGHGQVAEKMDGTVRAKRFALGFRREHGRRANAADAGNRSEAVDPKGPASRRRNGRRGSRNCLAATPARIGVWRTGTRPLTSENAEIPPRPCRRRRYGLRRSERRADSRVRFVLADTQYGNTENYFKRPDMGRVLTEESVGPHP